MMSSTKTKPSDEYYSSSINLKIAGVIFFCCYELRNIKALSLPTQNVRGVDLQDEPAVSLVGVGAEDGEDGALLPGLSQQLVYVHLSV